MRLLFFIVVITLIGCQSKNKAMPFSTELNGSLIVDPSDYSVQLIYHLDSLYNETLLILKKDENMNEEEAIEFIQHMIDNQLLPIPEVSFFDKAGNRQRKELKYQDFRKYSKTIISRK